MNNNISNILNFERLNFSDNIFCITLKNKQKYIIKFNKHKYFTYIQNEYNIYKYLKKKIKKNHDLTKNFSIIEHCNKNYLKNKNSKIKINNKSYSAVSILKKYEFFNNYLTNIQFPIEYIVTKYIPYTQPLYEFVNEYNDTKKIIDIINEILINIKTLHYKFDFFHGDLHRNNCIIDKDKKIYLYDFEYSAIYGNKKLNKNSKKNIINYFYNIKYDIYYKITRENNNLMLSSIINEIYFNHTNHYSITNKLQNWCIENIDKNYNNCTLFDFLTSISDNLSINNNNNENIVRWSQHQNKDFYNIIYSIISKKCIIRAVPFAFELDNYIDYNTPKLFLNKMYSDYIIENNEKKCIIKYTLMTDILEKKLFFSTHFLYYFDLNCFTRYLPQDIIDNLIFEKEFIQYMAPFNKLNKEKTKEVNKQSLPEYIHNIFFAILLFIEENTNIFL